MTQVCLSCRHWNLKDSPLREHGFGLCSVNPSPTAAGQTFAGNAPCRLKRWEKAPDAVIARRAKEGAGPR